MAIEDSQWLAEKIRVARIRPSYQQGWLIVQADELTETLVQHGACEVAEFDKNDSYVVQFGIMTRGELAALADFDGW